MYGPRIRNSVVTLILISGLLTASATAATVTLTLDSPDHETIVQPGDIINWSISFSVSTGDNAGLAFISVDLVQAGTNPTGYCMELGDYVPEEMVNFSRPYGISNRGEQTHWTGYVGTREDALTGGCNLEQIGGAQNTFSEPSELMGWNTDPDTDVGQGANPQLLLEGVFEAPNSRGAYILSLGNLVANVLDEYDSQNERWEVVEASVQYSQQNISFIVCPGDTNGDGSVDMSDLAAVLGAQNSCTGDANYDAAYDLDSSGCIDSDDLDIVLENYNTACE